MKMEKFGILREKNDKNLELDGFGKVEPQTLSPIPEEQTRELPWAPVTRNNSPASNVSSDWDSAELIDSSDDEEIMEIFTTSLDDYVKNCYPDKLAEFTYWITQSVRKLEMLSDLVIEQAGNTTLKGHYNRDRANLVNEKIRRIHELTMNVKRRNAENKTYFKLLFDLERFLSTTPSGLLISSQKLCRDLCTLLELWLDNSCFKAENYPRLKLFLREFFKNGDLLRVPINGDPPMKLIFNIWKKSLFFDEKRLELIQERRDFTKAFYFGFLMDRLDADVAEASFPLKTITELGQGNISVFHDFLVKNNIPFAGPYQAPLYWGKQIIYYLSSCNPTESVANGMAPLYGTFKFPLNSLNLPKEQALEFWGNLDLAPFWLNHFPPLFNSALDPMREQFYKLQ